MAKAGSQCFRIRGATRAAAGNAKLLLLGRRAPPQRGGAAALSASRKYASSAAAPDWFRRPAIRRPTAPAGMVPTAKPNWAGRSEEKTSELQSIMRISHAVFCLKKKNNT